jgi:hypothetical protein
MRFTLTSLSRTPICTITIGEEVIVFPLGYHLTVVDRETNTIRLEANSVVMTVTPKSQAKADAATGTDDK